MEVRKLRAVDLFCGAGGTTTGAEASGYADVVLAVNHWRVAVRTHQENHPETRHVCAEIDMVDPRDFLDMGIDVVFASPECIFHSNARGGKPVDDQKRATAWCVPRWAEVLRPKRLVIENVREFKDWGPLIEKRNAAGRIVKHKGETAWVPDKSRKGEIFQAWVAAIRGIGYHVEWKILNAADYGGATKRMRLFVVARYGKSTKPIPWPEATHTPDRYRTARTDVIDWSLPSKSIFDRPKMLSEKTLRRIEIGLRKFNGGRAPYLVDRNWQENRQGRNRVHDVDQPLGTVTTQGGQGVAMPIVVNLHGQSTAQPVDDPLSTVTGTRNMGLAQPFLTPNFGERDGQEARTHSVDEPMPTVTGRGAGNLIEPFMLPRQGVFDCRVDKPAASVDQPLNTITASHSPGALVQPLGADFILKAAGSGYNDPTFAGVTSADAPLPTMTTQVHHALVEPQGFVMDLAHASDPGGRSSSVDEPLGTVTTKHTQTLVEPQAFLVKYHGGKDPNRDGSERSIGVDQPMPTLDTQPRFALAEPFQLETTGRGAGRVRSIDEPVPTIVAARNTQGLIQPQPFVAHIAGPGSSRVDESSIASVDEPMRTILTREDRGLVQPQAFLTKYHGTSGAQSVDQPLGTVDGNDRHPLATPVVSVPAWFTQRIADLRLRFAKSTAMQSLLNTMEELGVYDVLYRMLVNKELARAQGFPDDYLLFGTSSEVTKQIGNSVHTAVACAITRAIGISEQPKKRKAIA